MKLPLLLQVALAAKGIAIALWLFAASPWLAAAVFIAPDPFLVYAVLAPNAGGLCRVFTRFVTPRREIWLTIDDGPDAEDTPRILDLLDRYRARATFFVIGERAARHPQLVTEILRRGHEIGHHTHTHPAGSFWVAGPGRLRGELDRTIEVLARIGVRARWFRAPVGIKHLLLAPALERRTLHYVGWSIRSGDSNAASAREVADTVIARLQPGAIVLVHEGPRVPRNVCVEGIALLLAELARQNFSCVLPAESQLR